MSNQTSFRSRAGYHARLARLEQSGAAFVTATVVTRRAPVSSHLGDQAIIHDGGRMEGFVGGACSREIIRKQALEVLATGRPRLVMIRPDASEVGRDDGETVVVPMTCASEGAVNVYLQPHLPARTLLVVGLTPVAEMLAWHVWPVWRANRCDRWSPRPSARTFPKVRTSLRWASCRRPSPPQLSSTSVVVASQGHYDELALEALLRAGVISVALLSSRKRAVTVRELLQLQGLSAEQTDAIRAPAEVAVSILAELVSLRQGRSVWLAPIQALEAALEGGSGESADLLPVSPALVTPSARWTARRSRSLRPYISPTTRARAITSRAPTASADF